MITVTAFFYYKSYSLAPSNTNTSPVCACALLSWVVVACIHHVVELSDGFPNRQQAGTAMCYPASHSEQCSPARLIIYDHWLHIMSVKVGTKACVSEDRGSLGLIALIEPVEAASDASLIRHQIQ